LSILKKDLYGAMFCPRCNREQETFDHVWLCTKNQNVVFLIMEKFRSNLLDLLNGHSIKINSSYLSHNTIWNINYDLTNFTFIDIIKGIVPTFLTTKIHNVTRDRDIVMNYLHTIYGEMYIEVKAFIWTPRCDEMLQKELSMGITKKEKKKKKRNNITNNSPSFRNLTGNDKHCENQGLDLEIKIGGNWLDFTRFRNHYSKLAGVVRKFYVPFIF